jgi:hypothetical protein
MLRIFAGRVYYVDDHAIWSVPARGGAPATRLVAVGDTDPTDVLVEPACLYWSNGRYIRRLELDRADAAPEIIADEENYQERDRAPSSPQRRPGTLASDGRFLYWPDAGGERIMRARRDPRPPPIRPSGWRPGSKERRARR